MNIVERSLTLAALAAAIAWLPAHAQQIYGTPGTPSATMSIDGRQLPPPPPAFGGVIKESAKDFSEDEWLAYSANLRTRPIMPDFAVRDMAEEDRRALYRFIRGLAEVVIVEVAGERDEEGLRVGRPLVVDDAAERRDALALAAGLLLGGEPLALG